LRASRLLGRLCLPALLIVLGGCGGGGGAVLIRVAGVGEVRQADLSKRIADLAPGHSAPDPPHFTRCAARLQAQTPEAIKGELVEECRGQYQELRQRALASLISQEWMIGEAAQEKLEASGGTVAEKARSAEAKIRSSLAHREPEITAPQVASYYRQNIARYEVREKRNINIVERIQTKAEASDALKRVIRRNDMSKVAIRELFEDTPAAETVPWKRAILKAIFSAKPHTLVGPLPLNEKWCFFEVTHVTPRVVKPLAQAQASIKAQLAAEQQRRTLTQFIAAWRRRWLARTDCSQGYVVQKCRQYKGPQRSEAPDEFN
jgi:hypothetical protein